MVNNVARVNYEIPDDLHRQAKSAAALRGQTLRDLVIEALREKVARVEQERNSLGEQRGE
jgi:predicted HicB family RNase H-like nuclease